MTASIEISPTDAAAMLSSSDAELVDVRRQDEWDAGRLDGARHIPLEEVTAAAASIDKQRPLIFYCHLGSRSLMAAEAFRAGGYDAYSMAGGIEAWSDAGLPVTGLIAD
jgi:rhodanese-related sulfurtransferase